MLVTPVRLQVVQRSTTECNNPITDTLKELGQQQTKYTFDKLYSIQREQRNIQRLTEPHFSNNVWKPLVGAGIARPVAPLVQIYPHKN